jgi:hypothetical protein
LVAVIAPVAFEPLVAIAPVQAPEAAHAVALVEVQANVELPPLGTLIGLALMETLGGVADVVTVADWDAEPPAPVHVSVNLVVVVRAAVAFEPLVATGPDHPPDAAHAVSLVDDHDSIAELPLLTVVGVADRVTAGTGLVTETVADCVALPPLPVQMSP